MEFAYSYPPSKNLLSYGELEEGSNFYGNGILYIANSKKIRCDFEVAFTQSGLVVVVCYFTYSNIVKSLGVKLDSSAHIGFSRDTLAQKSFKLIGREIKDNLLICIEHLEFRSMRSSASYDDENAVVLYAAWKYQVYVSDKDLRQSFNPKKNKIKAPFYNLTGLDFPDWFTDRFREISYSEFVSKSDFRLSLHPTTKPSQKLYDNQPTGKLHVKINKVRNWDTDELVEYWCVMVSLAIGKSINWTSKTTEISKWSVDHYEKQWRSQYLHGTQNFIPLIVKRGNLEIQDNWMLLQEFVGVCLDAVGSLRITLEESTILVRIVRQYIDYRLVSTATEEGQMRLITTLTEEFLSLWESLNDSKSPYIVTASERDKLLELIDEVLVTKKSEFLTTSTQNFDELRDKITSQIKNVRQRTFKERLQFFFDQYEFTLIDESDLKVRIKEFVKTRNAIAHGGIFNTFRNKKTDLSDVPTHDRQVIRAVTNEYTNAIMMLPLMIFAMIGYSGDYVELLGLKSL